MDYLEVLRKSAVYVWKHKFLWLLGVLIASGSAGGGGYSVDSNAIPEEYKNLDNSGEVVRLFFKSSVAKAHSMGEVLGSSAFNDYLWIWAIILALIVVVLLAIVYLKVAAKGAIISAIDTIDKDKETTLKSSWKVGHHLFWRRLSLSVVIILLLAAPLMILSIPVAILAVYELIILAVILGVLFGLVFLVYSIYIALIYPYSERFLVLRNDRAIKSISNSRKLFSKKWREIILMYLLLYILVLTATMIVFMALFFLIIPAILIGIGLALINPVLLMIYIGIMILLVFIVMLVVSGIINAYTSSSITLTFKEIEKKNT